VSDTAEVSSEVSDTTGVSPDSRIACFGWSSAVSSTDLGVAIDCCNSSGTVESITSQFP